MILEIMLWFAAIMVLLLTAALVAQVASNKRLKRLLKIQEGFFKKQTENFMQLGQSTTNMIGKIQQTNDAFTAIIAKQEEVILTLSRDREQELVNTKRAFEKYIKQQHERNARYPVNKNWPNPAS